MRVVPSCVTLMCNCLQWIPVTDRCELHRTAYAAAKQTVEDEVARLEQARANCETAKRLVTAARKQLPKQKAMKLRFFTEPPDVVPPRTPST